MFFSRRLEIIMTVNFSPFVSFLPAFFEIYDMFCRRISPKTSTIPTRIYTTHKTHKTNIPLSSQNDYSLFRTQFNDTKTRFNLNKIGLT